MLASAGQALVAGLEIHERDGDVAQVVLARVAGRSSADLLDGREEDADEYRDDRDNDEQLDQRERRPSLLCDETDLHS